MVDHTQIDRRAAVILGAGFNVTEAFSLDALCIFIFILLYTLRFRAWFGKYFEMHR